MTKIHWSECAFFEKPVSVFVNYVCRVVVGDNTDNGGETTCILSDNVAVN